jgi:hypothetical protein
MNKIRGLVVGVLLAVWCFPALSSAKALPPEPVSPAALVATGTTAETGAASSTAASTDSQSASFAQREQQATNLQDFKGGSAVIFIGSGTVLILLIVLLILII